MISAVRFALEPFSATREGAALRKTKKKATRSSEDLASLAGQKLLGGGKHQQQRTVRVRTAL